MAQIAITKTDKAADVARDLTDKAGATAEDRAGTSPPATAKPSVVLPFQAPTAFEMLKAGATMAGFWLQQGNDQLGHQARIVKKLAAAHDWRERLEIQSAFLRDSLSRLNQGVARYVDVTGAMMARSREARAGGALAAAASNKGQPR